MLAILKVREVRKNMDKVLETLQSFTPRLIEFGFDLFKAALIFIIGRLIIKFIIVISNRFFIKAIIDESVKKFLESLIKVILYLVLIIMICAQIGIQTTSLIALIGSAGLAIGLALQGSLSNFAGGVLILILKPFKVGDFIKEDTRGNEGRVSKIDLFQTPVKKFN